MKRMKKRSKKTITIITMLTLSLLLVPTIQAINEPIITTNGKVNIED